MLAIDLVYCLCQALEAEKICYCHWKSTAALDRSATGDNDLDLLVSRAHGHRFAAIMHRLGLKQAQASSAERLPGVLSYYGHDANSGKLVHVHAHYQLVLGQDRTKNYRLALEEPYLASAIQGELLRVPAPEFEFVVFVIRMVLKHSTWDAILSGQGKLSKSERQELVYLQPQVDWNKIQTLLAQHVPSLDACLFKQAVQALAPGADLRARIMSAHRIQRIFTGQSRRSPLVDVTTKLWRRLALKIERRFLRVPLRRTLDHGGALIGLVGGDGAGKSTAVQELFSWLAKDLSVYKIHMGKPTRSWFTLAVDAILKVERELGGTREQSVKAMVATSSPLRYVHMLRFACTARDRYRAYLKARRTATNGGIVICDRYPLPQLKMTDAPVLDQVIAAGIDNRFVIWLQRIECHYSAQILPPDMLIVLRVDPEIAVQRRTDEEAEWVRTRCQEIWDVDWCQTPAYVIDASRPRQEVTHELKSILWKNL